MRINRLYFFLVALFFTSCSITPRYHSFGYNVEWKSRIAQQTKPSASPLSNESQKRSQGETVEIKQAVHHPFTQPQAPIEKQENYRQEIGVNNHPFLKPVSSISAAESLPNQTEYKENFAREKPSSASLSKGLVQMQSTSHKSDKIGNHGNSLSNDPGGDLITIIGVILGILGIFFGSDSSSGGGWGGGGGRGGYFDWTAFWAISSVVIAAGGVVAAIALRGAVKPGIYTGILILPFTILGLPAGIIGLIKSVRDYYDVGKYLSIAALSLLGVMWIIALISL
jgi:hypothetical protein